MKREFSKKIWNDKNSEEVELRGIVDLPIGWKSTKHTCPKCGSSKLAGAIISKTADEADPNIICLECGYWWD